MGGMIAVVVPALLMVAGVLRERVAVFFAETGEGETGGSLRPPTPAKS